MSQPITSSSQIYGPWITPEKLAAIPELRREFDLNRDPLIALQIADLDKTEAERRRENSAASGSGGRSDDGRSESGSGNRASEPKPSFQLKPPPEISAPVDRAHHHQRLNEDRREAFLQQRSR